MRECMHGSRTVGAATGRPRVGVPPRQGAAVALHSCCMARQSNALRHTHFGSGVHDTVPIRLNSGQNQYDWGGTQLTGLWRRWAPSRPRARARRRARSTKRQGHLGRVWLLGADRRGQASCLWSLGGSADGVACGDGLLRCQAAVRTTAWSCRQAAAAGSERDPSGGWMPL